MRFITLNREGPHVGVPIELEEYLDYDAKRGHYYQVLKEWVEYDDYDEEAVKSWSDEELWIIYTDGTFF